MLHILDAHNQAGLGVGACTIPFSRFIVFMYERIPSGGR